MKAEDIVGTLLRAEDEVAAKVRTSHTRDLQVVHSALEQVLRGIDSLGSERHRTSSDLETAQILLAIRSFNSLRIAAQTMERGYYQQALALVRMAMEDRLVAVDAESNPATLDALMYDKGKLGRGELSYPKMAERISSKTKDVWDSDYGWASASAAHPRQKSMLGLTMVAPDGRRILRPGVYYDDVEVVNVLYHLLRELQHLMAQIAKVTHGAGIDWTTSAMSTLDEVDSAWRRLDRWASDQLAES